MSSPTGERHRFRMHDAESGALLRAAILLVVISALRWGWSRRPVDPSPGAESVLPELLADSREAADEGDRRQAPLADAERIDPNRADEVDLDRLPGVGPATARAIVESRDRGLVFQAPGDLLAVPGIGPATLERIRPHLALGDPPPRRGRLVDRPGDGLVDLNRADVRRLQSLPGIGPALAARIVAERQKGMFTDLEDLERVNGIGPATVERLRSLAMVGRGP